MDRHERCDEGQSDVSLLPLLVFGVVFVLVLGGLMLVRPANGGSPARVLRKHGLTRRRAVRKARKEYPVLYRQSKGRTDVSE